MCTCMQLYKISYKIFEKNYLTVWYRCGSELTPWSFFEQQDLFIIYQSYIYEVCLIKSNSEERGVRKKGKSEADHRLCFGNCPSLTLLALFKKKMIKGLKVQHPLRVARQMLCDDWLLCSSSSSLFCALSGLSLSLICQTCCCKKSRGEGQLVK